MQVEDVLEITIIDDNHMGNGIGKKDDFTIFVPKAVKGDIVKIKVDKITKKIAYASVIEFIKVDSNHIKIKCPYYDKCGGCDLLHISYEREKELKENYIKKLFPEFNKKIISYDRDHYRNKVTLHVNNNEVGFYEKSSNCLIPIKECLLLNSDINKTINLVNQLDLSDIREIIIKKADDGILISIDGCIKKDDLEILKANDIKSIYQNNKLLYGKEYLTIDFDGVVYNINNNSFFQINNDCAKTLYEKIKEKVEKCNNLLDLYCGTGSIGIYLNKNAKSITGIEINEDSVKCAKKNIVDNKITNYKIINADASFIDREYDVVIVDPPRSGLSKDVINILNAMNSQKIIYISCNPSTLKRDINRLNNYCLKEISIFNMFPGTKHIEALTVLEKERR